MATKPENVNPFAKYVEQSAEVAPPENPFAKYLTPQEEEPSQILDPAKMIAAGAVGPTAAIPLGIESAIRNVPRQVVEQQGITPVSKVGPMTFAEELVKKGPGQLFTNTARAFIKSATGESFEKQQERQTQDQIAVDRAISKLPRIPGLSQLADAGEKVSERFRESVSAAGKQAIADSQVEGNLLEAIQNRSVENLSFGKNPSFMGYALQGSQVLGSLVPIITTAVVTKGSSKAVGTVGFGMGAGEAVQDAQQYVSQLNDEQLMQSSPFFKKMVEDGVSPVEARKVVTDKAAEYAAQLQGSVSAFGSVITGKLITGQFDKLMTGPVKNRLGRIALGTTAGAAEEGTQEFLEGIAKDLGINKAVIKEIGEESFANFVLGSLGGAGPGAYRGAVAKTKEEAEAAAKKPTKAEIDAQMRATLGEGAPLPPGVSPAPGVTPPITPASATIEEADVEAIAPAPRVAPTPTPMILQTAGLAPEVAGQVQNLEGQFQMIEQRKLDPNLTEEELKIFNDRQDLIKQEISQLIQAPQAAPQVAPPVDEKLLSNIQERGEPVASRMEAEKRLSNGEQIYGFLEQDENRPRLITSVDELAAYTPDQLMALPSAPEIVQSFPMGENSELQVIKNDKGYVTNLYDKDADQYLGTMKLFPTETFGEEAEAKAIEFAKSEANKATKYEPPAAEVTETPQEAEPLDLKSEQAYRMRITVEELEKDPKNLTARNINPLARELGIDIRDFNNPQGTLKEIKKTLGMPTATEYVATKLTTAKDGYIADKDGKPIVFYHTTRALDEKGNQVKELIPGGPNGEGSGKAIWFGPDPNVMQAAHNAPLGYEGSYTIPAYIKMQNPLYIDEFNYEEQRAKWGPDLPYSLSDERVNKLKDAGFDGIISELEAGVIDEVVVFDKNQVTFKADYKPVAEAPAPTQAEINRQRQAEKKAKVAVPEEEKIVDAIREMAYDKNLMPNRDNTADDFITKHGKKMFDRAVELDLLDNQPGAGRLFASNNFVYNVLPKYYTREGKKVKEPTVVELPKKEEAPAIQVTPNKIFTEDAATKARNRLRSKLNQLNSGIDPEFLIDGITLSGYHIEKGARTFAAYAKAMIADLGDKVKPYLKQWYNAVRDDPSAKSLVDDMDTYDQVQKAELPDTTEGAVDLMDPSGKFKIAEDISKHFLDGNGFKDITEARKFITNITGQKIEPGTAQAKEADEAVEVGVVLASRQIAKGDNVYDNLVDLYNRQPNLSVRTSTSISEQAYSTPAPLAYVASQLAGINKNSTVYEPTAGNGMLLIDASPKNVIANELNGTRYEMLERVMDGATINNENAVKLDISKEFDAIIANPPFGVVKDREGKTISYDVDGFKSNEIDHAIAFKALNNMKDDGRAVLIVGGVMGKTEDGRREGYRSPSKRNFYYNLYQKYNVVDHFTVSGDLYKKQGAAYPVDVIVIAGKGGESIELPAANVPKVYSSYEQLKEKLDEASRMVSRGAERPARTDLGEATPREGEPQAVGRGAVRPSEPAGAERREPRGGEPTGVSAARPTPSGEPSRARAEPRAEQPKPTDVSERGRVEGKPLPRGEGVEPTGRRVTEERKPSTVGGPSIVSGERVKSGLVERRGEEVETAGQVTYKPHSQATSVGTLVPRAMRDSIEQSLQKVENEMGSLDEYVSDSIGMDLETLREDFSAEQIDALALAIRNAEAGKGFIIGDQTGIGKGRVVAAMIKFAIRSGKIPIFVTEKPNLYSDMIRDLDDIGMTRELALDTAKSKIFITNGGESIPYQLLRKKGEQVEEINLTLKAPKSGKALDGMMEELRNKESLGDYKVIFTTYSQLQTVKGKDTERQRFIKTFGAGNYMIFDESHNAGGAGETQARSKEQREAAKKGESLSTGRSAFVRNLVNNAFGTFFSSATYAKRPDVMDLYSSTNMMLAVDKPADLAEAIKRGGVPMQQIVATMLTKDGQYIRRERTFAGIAYNTIDTNVEKETAENMATAMRDILAFSRSKDVALKQMQKTLDKEAKMVTEVGGEKTTVQGANFGSVMHNLIDQMLLSLKAKDSVRHAIDRLKAGEKVVMTVSNTMGSFLQSYAEDMNINVGERLDLSFADLYIRYLDKQLMITIKTPDGKKTQRKLTPDELGPTLMARYNQIRQQIENSGFGSAPISPIDYMHSELRKAGYKTDEITGRTVTLNYTTGEPILTTRSANIRQRVNAVRGFNGGDTDVIILNQAGSTGLSLHASNKFKDQSKRHMIIVQAEKNIDVHVQTLGRVNRTGQVVVPAYSQMMADIPAEMRPAAVLLKKMASLNANTTASRKSAVTAEGVVDFMNDYGGQVAQEYLRDNPEIHNALGGDKMLAIAEDTNEALEADIRRFTGYIPILPLAQQEEVYADLIDRYNELLERENSMGTNRLEAKAFDLDAETLSVEALTEDKGEDSVFSTPAFMERVDVKRTVKPYSSQEIKEMVNENLGGKTKQQIAKEFISEFDERENKYFNEKMADLKEKETDPIKIDEQQGRQRLMAGQIRSVLQNIQIGDPVTIKDKNGVYVYGMITDIKNVKRTVNPASGSDWKMILAVANGDSKSLTLNFSQIGTNYTLEKEDVVNYLNPETQQGEYVPIIDIFDKGASVRREKRWMITGNILAGFAQYPGQILTYTKNDGTTGQGILMSRQFDFEREKKSADVRLKTPQDMMRFLDELGGTISSDDNVIRITKRGDTYMFDLPSNKRSGGEYFLDKNLTDILGRRDFYKRGSSMLNYTRDPAEFAQAIDYLMKEKEQFFKAVTYQEQARKMFAPKPVLEDLAIATDFKMSDLELKAPNFIIPKGTRLFHGAYLTKAEEIELAGKMLLARQKKKSGGGRMDEGNLVWFGDKDLAKAHSESAVDLMRAMADRESGIIRDPGKVFSTVTDRPYKLMNYNYVLTGKDAAKLNKALGLPDYKSVQKGDSAWQAAYRAHDNGENVPSYEVEGSGRMSAPWPIILETLGYDGYFNESGIAFAAKNAVYLGDEKTPMRVENLTGVTSQDADTRRDEVRAEKIKRSAELSRGISAIKRQIIKGNIGINIQRELTFLEQAKKGINKEIAKTKPARKSAEWVRAKAAAEVAAKNIDNDTYKVIEALATRYPAVLDGLTLSMIKPNVAGVSGNFEPVQRIVTLYKGSATDKTMRHEIAHSMEQMMTPEAQTAVVNAWADALQKAIEDNTDQVSQDYFEAVFDYLQNPTEANYRKATNALPDYKLYQFINPSEYWAVNAEPLLKAQLGGGWQKFKKAMQRLLETIKDILGFDNKRTIHREFARIMSGDQQRITNTMLVEYVTDNADSLKFLNNVEDFDKKFQEDGLNHTPVKPSRGIKDLLLGGFRGARQVYKDAKEAPLMASQAMGGKLVRAITYVRNKNIWYGAGLEMADLLLQKTRGLEGMLRDGEMRAIASVAVTNALHAGHIASEVIIRGALAFNAKTQMFQAIRRPFSMANVLLAKHDLIERVGLQRATDMVNTFFEAKRSKSIMDEFKAREKELQNLNNEMRDPRTSAARQALLLDEILQAEKGLRMINIAKKKVRFDEEQIKFYGNLEKANPELRTMLDNWTKVNDNMIDMMLFSKIIGEKRAKQLKGIKDYVPWYRIQDDMQDLHQASQMGGIKRLTNVGKEKRFEDTVVVQDIDDIVDNMLHNVAMITRNSMRNYAANRVAQEYATRNKKNQIAVFPEEGRTPEGAVRTNILVNGRRIIIEIKDPLIAESVLGMENINMPAMDMLSALANGLRRGVTLWPQFQIRQLFMDAPTAALVTGLKDPTRVWAGTFRGFIKALQSDDPVVDMLKSYGIGGYQSYTRTPEIEYKQQIGLMEKNKFDALMGLLDRVGDASDYGQRVSVYNNTLRQTGDEMLALLQANNVIDFLKRGSARHAQFLTKTVSFMNAYAQQIDILAMSLVGKRLTGKARGAALAQLAKTGATFGFYVMLYSMAVGDDDEYQKLDDQTKVRNIFLSKNWTGLDNNILIPMHTSASFMFKSIPELTYNYVTTQGTNNEMDGTRLRTALREAAFDSLLGPNLISTGVKPFAEITLNRNFFTGSTVTPKGMEDLDAVEQYTASTSQLGKVISALTSVPFTENKRVLNPIEADHLVRGLFGTTGSAAQWLSNMFGEDRPSATTRQNPLYGSFVAPDVARGNEDLFYDFKKMVDNKYETYMKLLERDKADEADKYFDKHEALISARDYVTSVEVALRDINRQIRMAGEVKDKTVTPEQRRQEIIDLQRSKQEMLDSIVEMRLEAKL